MGPSSTPPAAPSSVSPPISNSGSSLPSGSPLLANPELDRRSSSIAALRLKAREHELRLEMMRKNGTDLLNWNSIFLFFLSSWCDLMFFLKSFLNTMKIWNRKKKWIFFDDFWNFWIWRSFVFTFLFFLLRCKLTLPLPRSLEFVHKMQNRKTKK